MAESLQQEVDHRRHRGLARGAGHADGPAAERPGPVGHDQREEAENASTKIADELTKVKEKLGPSESAIKGALIAAIDGKWNPEEKLIAKSHVTHEDTDEVHALLNEFRARVEGGPA